MAALADMKAADLKELLESVNADRDDSNQIVPESLKKDDIAAALEAAGVEAPEVSEPASKGEKSLKVVAPLVAVKIGEQILQYRAGDVLPAGIDKDAIKRLNDLGFIAEA